jgi:membrane-associated phospholipid phosphatase
VGEHYPLDVLGGVLLGGIHALIIWVSWFKIGMGIIKRCSLSGERRNPTGS